MSAPFGATAAKRLAFVTVSLRVRLCIAATLILFSFTCNVSTEAAANPYEFHAFTAILKQQNLQHAVITYNSEMLQSLQREYLHKDSALRTLANMAMLHFYDVHQTKRSKNYIQFQKLFYHESPRVGIYLTQLEDVLLQEHVLGTNAISVDIIDAEGYRLHAGVRFNNSQVWFMMSKQRSVEAALMNARRVLTPLPLNISADITLGVRVDDNNTIQLFDIYKIQRDWLEIEAKGNWSLSDGLQIEQKYLQSYVSRRRNFKGLTLSAGIVVRERPEDMDELQYLSSMDHKKLDPMQRKTYQLMKLMEPMFALSFEAISRPTWGAQLSNGSWDGVMALILSGRAEFSLCPMRFVLNRIHLMDYSIAVHTEFVFFIFRHPRRNSIRNIFFEPFADEVWYTTVAVIVLAISLLFLLLRHEHQFLLNKDPHFQYRLDYAILSILEAFFEQGPETNAFTATSTRMLVFTVCVFSLLLQQFYGAFIVGSLLAVAPRSITTLDALYNSSLEIGMENIPYNTESFENTMVPLGMAIYKERICKNREKHILSIEEGAERIKKGGFAFHVSANRMYILLKSLLSEKEFCELQDVPFIAPYRIGMGITKGSPFREYVTTSIIKFRTTSILQHNDNQWQLPRMDCSLSQNREVEVDLQHFLPALLLLCSAMIFSFFILFLELVYYYFESNTKLARLCPRIFPEQRLEFIN